jgi:hypothetical protein
MLDAPARPAGGAELIMPLREANRRRRVYPRPNRVRFVDSEAGSIRALLLHIRRHGTLKPLANRPFQGRK